MGKHDFFHVAIDSINRLAGGYGSVFSGVAHLPWILVHMRLCEPSKSGTRFSWFCRSTAQPCWPSERLWGFPLLLPGSQAGKEASHGAHNPHSSGESFRGTIVLQPVWVAHPSGMGFYLHLTVDSSLSLDVGIFFGGLQHPPVMVVQPLVVTSGLSSIYLLMDIYVSVSWLL